MHRILLSSLILMSTLCLFSSADGYTALAWEEEIVVQADLYGAIAFSPTTAAHGYSFDYANRAAAERKAINECERHAGSGDCQAILWFHNACGALALGDNAYGSGWGTDMLYAALYAMESCEEMTDNCKVIRWVCTSNALTE